jgi:hypothetical protein
MVGHRPRTVVSMQKRLMLVVVSILPHMLYITIIVWSTLSLGSSYDISGAAGRGWCVTTMFGLLLGTGRHVRFKRVNGTAVMRTRWGFLVVEIVRIL